MENLETALEPEGTRKKLKRELRAEAMTRLEEAARTEADFENVISCWDKLDANRERKERYHEPIRGDMTLENGLKYNGRRNIFPISSPSRSRTFSRTEKTHFGISMETAP